MLAQERGAPLPSKPKPTGRDARRQEARAAFQNGEFAKACPMFQDLATTATEPTDRLVSNFEAGQCFLRAGSYRQAQNHFKYASAAVDGAGQRPIFDQLDKACDTLVSIEISVAVLKNENAKEQKELEAAQAELRSQQVVAEKLLEQIRELIAKNQTLAIRLLVSDTLRDALAGENAELKLRIQVLEAQLEALTKLLAKESTKEPPQEPPKEPPTGAPQTPQS